MQHDGLTTTDSEQHPMAPRLLPEVTLVVSDHPERELVGANRLVSLGDEVLLGRSVDNGMPGVLDESKVSRRHAVISRVARDDGDALSVTDLGSRNGTFVNGERIVGTRRVHVGDVVCVGNVVLSLIMAPPAYAAPDVPGLIGVGPGLSAVCQDIRTVAGREMTVLVIGETGTGKELVAQAIHDLSGRSGQFVALNCAGVTDALLTSELFGHVRGAFTGAVEKRRGLLNTARGGTLMLDEVADASPAFQASLLRLLEKRVFRAVGADAEQHADVRFVAAGQPRVRQAVDEGGFRPDLWARLAQWIISIPPLRERREDVAAIGRHLASSMAGRPMRLTPRLSSALMRHDWPFNVRELQAAIQRALVASDEELLDLTPGLERELNDAASNDQTTRADNSEPAEVVMQRRVQRPSKGALVEALRARGGNVSSVAKSLGVNRKSVYRWVESYGIDIDGLRGDE